MGLPWASGAPPTPSSQPSREIGPLPARPVPSPRSGMSVVPSPGRPGLVLPDSPPSGSNGSARSPSPHCAPGTRRCGLFSGRVVPSVCGTLRREHRADESPKSAGQAPAQATQGVSGLHEPDPLGAKPCSSHSPTPPPPPAVTLLLPWLSASPSPACAATCPQWPQRRAPVSASRSPLSGHRVQGHSAPGDLILRSLVQVPLQTPSPLSHSEVPNVHTVWGHFSPLRPFSTARVLPCAATCKHAHL